MNCPPPSALDVFSGQVAFGSERGIRFRPSEHDAWTEYGGAIIPSRQPLTHAGGRPP